MMNQVFGCPGCLGLLRATDQRHVHFAWAVLWTCPTCNQDFHCCDSTCGAAFTRAFGTRLQLARHHRRNHKKQRVDMPMELGPGLAEHDDDITFMSDDNNTHDTNDNCHRVPIDVLACFDGHPPTRQFFDDLGNHSVKWAVQCLVARACYQDANIDYSTYPRILDNEVALFFRIARLVFATGAKQQHLLGGVLSGLEMRYLSPGSLSTSAGLPLPTTYKAFNSTLLNPTNQNSLTSIIPRPPAVVLSGRHAYVSIPALVAYELGLAHAAIDPPFNPKFERLVNSPHGQELLIRAKDKLLEDATLIACPVNGYLRYVVLLFMWFDGWDPNGSSKGNRSPVWSGTLTMVFANMNGDIVAVATYPFAVGPGKVDHNIIFQHILDDVRALQAPLPENGTSCRWYRSRAAQQMVLVYGEVFCIWQDQPGRRQETNTLGGNSLNHAIFGISCYVKHLRKPVAACDRCREATVMYLDKGNFQSLLRPACSACTNWCFPVDPNAGLYQSCISEKFPVDAVVGKDFNLGGGAIDFTLLIAAWQEACGAVTAGRWTDTAALLYLKTLCVNEATVKAMLHQCRNYMLWTEIGADPESYDAPTCATYRQQFAANPDRFAIPLPPAAWSLGTLSLHVETIMHLGGGVQKAVAKFVHRYATSLGHGVVLTARLAFPIALVHKYCRVQYLPLAAYNTDKFGGWVMENFKVLCILAPWVYHCLDDEAFQPPPRFVTPTTPRDKWIQTENIGYLRSRGIAIPARMLAAEARSAVAELFAQPGGPPAAVVNPASTVTPRDMRRLWLSCSTMFKDLMRVHHNAVSMNRTDARVRAFLSEIEALDAVLQPARLKPLYLAKYNFPSLLRAVDHLRQFGNIRDLHEGGIEGEGMVKHLRPLVTNGLKDQFATHLLSKVFRDYTLDRLLLNHEHQGGGASPTLDNVCGSMIAVAMAPLDGGGETEAETLQRATLEEEPDPFQHLRHMLDDEVEDLGDDLGDGAGDSGSSSGEPATLWFRRYSSRATVEHYFRLGVPISVVITNQAAQQRIGVIVATCNQWWLLPLCVGRMQYDDDLGFTYFHINLHPTKEKMLVQTKVNGENPINHIEILNYGHLLPANWLDGPVPYALLNMEGEHLDAESNFV
jgi:hypothetical protein